MEFQGRPTRPHSVLTPQEGDPLREAGGWGWRLVKPHLEFRSHAKIKGARFKRKIELNNKGWNQGLVRDKPTPKVIT